MIKFPIIEMYFTDTKTGERKRRHAICTLVSGKKMCVIPISSKMELFDANEDFLISKSSYGIDFLALGFPKEDEEVHAFNPEVQVDQADVIRIKGELVGKLLEDFMEWYG